MKKFIGYLLLISSVIISCQSQKDWIYQDFIPDNNFVPVRIDGKYTYLDTRKGEIAKGAAPYDDAGCFYEGIALVKTNDKYSYINKKFEPINNEEYAEASIFSNGRAWVVKEFGKITAIDTKGREVFVLDEAEEAFPFRDGVAVFMNHEGKYGLVNVDGRIVVNAVYGYMDKCSRHNAVEVSLPGPGGDGIIDISGKEIMACTHEGITYDKNSRLIGVVAYGSERDSLYNLSSKKEVALKTKHKRFIPELKGMFRFNDDEENCGWCDNKGKVIIYPKYNEWARVFDKSEVALVSVNGSSASLINRKGIIVSDLPMNPRRIYGGYDENGLMLVKFSSFVEAVNEDGEIVISNQYEYIWHVSEDIYLCRSENGADIVNGKGKIISSYTGDINFYYKKLIEDWDDMDNWPESVENRYVDIEGILSDVSSILKENAMPYGITPGLVKSKYGLENLGWRTLLSSGEKTGFDYRFYAFKEYGNISEFALSLNLKGAANRNYQARESVYSKIKEHYSGNDNSKEVSVPEFSDFQSWFSDGSFTFSQRGNDWIQGIWLADLDDGRALMSINREEDCLIEGILDSNDRMTLYKYSIENNTIKPTVGTNYYLINYDDRALYYNGKIKMTKVSGVPASHVAAKK